MSHLHCDSQECHILLTKSRLFTTHAFKYSGCKIIENPNMLEQASGNFTNYLEWTNVNVSIKEKLLLDFISGSVRSGELMALMGPSGSGKTTLLNHLSGRRQNSQFKSGGDLLYCGTTMSNARRQTISRYVEQEDHLIGSLTVYETIDFAGKLCGLTSKTARKERIEYLLEGLGLTNQRNVIVGTPLKKGLSGGQKRRLSIACELITMPQILFLDEPTSGLDSKASFEVISTIKKIAIEENIIVIASIHQPSSSTFKLFDKVSFMTNGQQIYNGSIKEVKSYFENNDIVFNEDESLCDFILDLINTDFQSSNVEVVNRLQENWARVSQEKKSLNSFTLDNEGATSDNGRQSVVKPLYQAGVLLHRSFIKSYRDFLAYYVRIFMYLGLAIMMGTVWLRLKNQQDYIQPYINAIFFSGAFMSFMSVAYIPAYIEDLNSYRREKLNGLYGPFAFIISNFLISIPFLFLTTIIFSVVTYFLCRFNQTAAGFWKYVMWLFLDLIAAESLTVLISTVFPVFVIALALTAFANGLWMSVGGFLVPQKVLNVFWYYTFYWIDYQRYVFQGMMFNQFENTVYDCDANCHCMYASELQDQCKIQGKAVLEAVGYSHSDIGLWIGIILVIIFVMRLLSYIALKIKN